jgi:hypothetical protein
MPNQLTEFEEKCRTVDLVELLNMSLTEQHETLKRVASSILGQRLADASKNISFPKDRGAASS